MEPHPLVDELDRLRAENERLRKDSVDIFSYNTKLIELLETTIQVMKAYELPLYEVEGRVCYRNLLEDISDALGKPRNH